MEQCIQVDAVSSSLHFSNTPLLQFRPHQMLTRLSAGDQDQVGAFHRTALMLAELTL
jgi:hypothetical protein